MTTGRINQVCASPPATHLNPQGVLMCREAVVNKVWFSHHTQVTIRDGYCTLSELAPWHPKTRQNEKKESFQRALPTRFRFALTRCKQSTALLKGSSSCLALQFSSSINTHKGPCLKAANFAPSTERSRDPLTTMTQCVLVGKEPNSQSTIPQINSLNLPFPLFPFRGSVSFSLSLRAVGEVPFFPPPMFNPFLLLNKALSVERHLENQSPCWAQNTAQNLQKALQTLTNSNLRCLRPSFDPRLHRTY